MKIRLFVKKIKIKLRQKWKNKNIFFLSKAQTHNAAT